MSAPRPLPTHPSAPRAAAVVVAHRRDAAGVPWARAGIADEDALETALGQAAAAGLSPVLAVVGQGDPSPDRADDVIEVDPRATDAEVLVTVHERLARAVGAVPRHVVVVPVEQPLASGTLLWTLVATCEARPGVSIAAGHRGRAGHPRVLRAGDLVAASALPVEVLEAGELALYWTAESAGAGDASTRTRARALLATSGVLRERLAGGAVELDVLAAEEPLELHLGAESLAVLMRTPGHDAELATGFLLTEAVVERAEEILGLEVQGNHVVVAVGPDVMTRARARRAFMASSACGVCGKASIDDVVLRFPRVRSSLTVPRALLAALPGRLGAEQTVFARTGGLHAAALFDRAGELLVLREDVGRHNAVDKVVGWAAQARALPLHDRVLVVSGRIGFEIAQKAVAAGIPIVAAVGAPTSLAVSLAEAGGVTLAGFLRDGDGNLYTHPERAPRG